MQTFVVRTSDRRSFKKCRQAWDFGSPLRKNLKPKQTAAALELGTAVHAGLQVYYSPDLWTQSREVVEAFVLTEFHRSMNESWALYKEFADVELEAEFAQSKDLGEGMLRHYMTWAPKQDAAVGLEPYLVEIEFEVPILKANGTQLLVNVGDVLNPKWLPAVYQGRIDMIVKDQDGQYWIFDHKTAKQLQDSQDSVDMDEQFKSYAWAIQQKLGIPIAGVIVNELRKDVPHPPKTLNSGALSVAKQQNTTYELYIETIRADGHNPEDYVDILEFLKEQGNKFFRRTQAYYSQTELALLGDQIALETLDMASNPNIYPNPSRINCFNCAYKKPCLMKMDGSDYEWFLKENYIHPEDLKAKAKGGEPESPISAL